MNDHLRFAVGAAAMGIIAKMCYFLWFPELEEVDNGVRLLYLLFFLIALFFGLRTYRKKHPSSEFTHDVKSGMKITSVFSLIMAAFTYVFYAFVFPEYFEVKKVERIAAVPAEQVEAVTNNVEFIFSPFIHSTITLMGLMVVGFFYTLVLVLILRAAPKSLSV